MGIVLLFEKNMKHLWMNGSLSPCHASVYKSVYNPYTLIRRVEAGRHQRLDLDTSGWTLFEVEGSEVLEIPAIRSSDERKRLKLHVQMCGLIRKMMKMWV